MEDLIEEHRSDGGIVIISSHQNLKLRNAVSLKMERSETSDLVLDNRDVL